MSEVTTRAKYLELFAGNNSAGSRQTEALKHALDIRKFEIELYWKRATYFWTFIGAAFGGFFAVQSMRAPFEMAYLLACLGLVFSTAWYFGNRGSKCWQKNWESHVDLLEEEVMGPLYKTGINRYAYRFLNLTDAYPFSVSKINQILNLFIIAIWLFLIGRTVLSAWPTSATERMTAGIISVITIVSLVVLFFAGRTTRSDRELNITVRTRRYQ